MGVKAKQILKIYASMSKGSICIWYIVEATTITELQWHGVEGLCIKTKTKLEKTRCSRHLAQCGLSAQQLPSSHDDHPGRFGIIMKGYCCNC